MHWTGYVVVVLVIFNAGWMLFDGTRALIVGDYLTPRTGDRAGRLGPWARVVSAVGLDPRSTPVKLAFVVYGAAALGLWYLPVGMAINAVVLVLLFIQRGV